MKLYCCTNSCRHAAKLWASCIQKQTVRSTVQQTSTVIQSFASPEAALAAQLYETPGSASLIILSEAGCARPNLRCACKSQVVAECQRGTGSGARCVGKRLRTLGCQDYSRGRTMQQGFVLKKCTDMCLLFDTGLCACASCNIPCGICGQTNLEMRDALCTGRKVSNVFLKNPGLLQVYRVSEALGVGVLVECSSQSNFACPR